MPVMATSEAEKALVPEWKQRLKESLPDVAVRLEQDAELFGEDYSIYDAFFELLPLCDELHKNRDPRNVLPRIYAFAEWCAFQEEKELWNAAGVAFYEHLVDEPEMMEAMPRYVSREVFTNVHTSYGLTEMSSQVTTTPPGMTPAGLRTSGRVLPYREVAISGDGEILVRGETLFAGYVRDDGLERPVDEAGWFHTGDLGELEGKGYLRVRGRKDNLFISGGENIQPEEIEEYLERLEGVERAVVVPVPDEYFGERPSAFVLPADGRVTPRGLAGELERELPRFKVPVAFYEWPEGADPGKTKVDRPFFRDRARRHELGDET